MYAVPLGQIVANIIVVPCQDHCRIQRRSQLSQIQIFWLFVTGNDARAFRFDVTGSYCDRRSISFRLPSADDCLSESADLIQSLRSASRITASSKAVGTSPCFPAGIRSRGGVMSVSRAGVGESFVVGGMGLLERSSGSRAFGSP